jgi:hypothetical protein
MALFSVWTLFGVQVGLGFPEIRRDDQPCRLALRKGLAWLIYLAQAKGSVDLASHIAQAQLVELDGADHWAFAGDQQPVLASIRQFVGSLGA